MEKNVSLAQFTTFHVGGKAAYFVHVKTLDELQKGLNFCRQEKIPIFILGGGSNMLVSDRGFSGAVIQLKNLGIEILEDNENGVIVKAYAGHEWDAFVEFAVSHGWWGIENLSHIPGSVGGAPVQNIGAYGQEVGNVILSVQAVDKKTGEQKKFSHEECAFGYRKSVFNSTQKDNFIIWSVTFRLSKISNPQIDYPDVKRFFEERNIVSPHLQNIRDAIISIRDAKLPDPRIIGNAGSFFKNLIFSKTEYQMFEKKIQDRLGENAANKIRDKRFEMPDDAVKVPSALVIDLCGLKGKRVGDAMVHERQPLVIVNTGKATASDILRLAGEVRRTVFEKTGAILLPEPLLIGFSDEELHRYFEIH